MRAADGTPLPERRLGRIAVRGPSLMAGYFGQPDATASALVHGWLDTGDLGFIVGGELYVCGREKDAIIIRGANHAPQEFEECVAGIAGIRPGGVAALSCDGGGSSGEQLLILAERARGAVAGDGDSLLVEAISRAVLERTGIRPHIVRILDAGTLLRTSSGKLRRADARRRFVAGQLVPLRPVTRLRLVAAALRSALAFARARVGRER